MSAIQDWDSRLGWVLRRMRSTIKFVPDGTRRVFWQAQGLHARMELLPWEASDHQDSILLEVASVCAELETFLGGALSEDDL